MEGTSDLKRQPKPSMQILESNLEDSSAKLEGILSTDLSVIKNESQALRKLCSDVKINLNKFVNDSTVLALRYSERGCPSKSQEIHIKKRSFMHEASHLVNGVNLILIENGSDEVSNLDSSSVRSGFSLSSQIPHIIKEDSTQIQVPHSSPTPPLNAPFTFAIASTSHSTNFSSLPVPVASAHSPYVTQSFAPAVQPQPSSNYASNIHVPPVTPHTYVLPQHVSAIASQPASHHFPITQLSTQVSQMNIRNPPPLYTYPSVHYPTSAPPQPPVSAPVPPHQHGHYFPNPGAPPIQSSASMSAFSAAQVMSKHLLQQDMVKKSIDTFDGCAYRFWPWVGKIRSYVEELNLTPLQTLQVIEAHTTKGPHTLVSNSLAAAGDISPEILQEVWDELIRQYGATKKIAEQLLEKVKKHDAIKGQNQDEQLNSLYSLLKIVEYNQPQCPELKILDYSNGIEFIRYKLPVFVQQEWRKFGTNYENTHDGCHPPFGVFVQFIKRQAHQLSNRNYEIKPPSDHSKKEVKILQTDTVTISEFNSSKPPDYPPRDKKEPYCYYHKSKGHSLPKCPEFKKLSYADKKKLVYDSRLCFKCTGKHKAADCKSSVKCAKCDKQHMTILHPTSSPNTQETPDIPNTSQPPSATTSKEEATVMCTSLSDDSTDCKNCSKTVLVEITMEGVQSKSLVAYALIDEHANKTVVDEEVVSYFDLAFPVQEYRMNFAKQGCSINTTGHLVSGLKVRGIYCREIIKLPKVLTCDDLTDTTHEVATPDLVKKTHAKRYAKYFPPLKKNTRVLLIIGRDCGRAMANEVLINSEPYVHKTALGYALLGRTCEQNSHYEDTTTILRTNVQLSSKEPMNVTYNFNPKLINEENTSVFASHSDDDLTGLSRDDKIFLQIMQDNVCTTADGHLQLPLPLKGKIMPDNRMPVYYRTKTTLKRLETQPDKMNSCIESMQKSIIAGYIEQVPPQEIVKEASNVWYLPLFCIFNSKKNKVRPVFDGSARYSNISLNDNLYQGPDLTNHLRGVLLRFRENPIAIGADIEAMFNNFKVPPEQRNYLRFWWYQDNDINKPLVIYRSTCHIFGLSSSPSVCNFGLKYSASSKPDEKYHTTRKYVHNSFYVDDGISSFKRIDEAVTTLQNTIEILASNHLRLHKIISNSPSVLEAFPESEIAMEKAQLQLHDSTMQRTLGVTWDTKSDSFVMNVTLPLRPYTKRGVVAVINSIYDPIGLVSPVTLTGRLIQRDILPPKDTNKDTESLDWDDELPQLYREKWDDWKSSLYLLDQVSVPRCISPSPTNTLKKELHVYCDASEQAIGYVIYMRTVSTEGNVHVAFVSSASKVAPRSATTMPRLELNAACEAATATTYIIRELDEKPGVTFMYSDSKIVLGYLSNTHRRFTKYVERRVAIILTHTPVDSWSYVNTKENPADHATRGMSPTALMTSQWFHGPKALWSSPIKLQQEQCCEHNTANLPEEKVEAHVLLTQQAKVPNVLASLLNSTNKLNKVINAAIIILKIIHNIDKVRQRQGISLAQRSPDIDRNEAIKFLVRNSQQEAYSHEITLLKGNKNLPESSKIVDLSPRLDKEGILRVGGRLKNADLPFSIKHPILLPKDHRLSLLIAMFYHEDSSHQGGHISHGTLRQAGFHIEHGRQLIRHIISNCVLCKRMRSPPSVQLMSDLPEDRVNDAPPFQNVGIDVFGHFYVNDGISTRRTSATKKIWCLIFVCLPSRAIHIEPLVSMDTSSFRNALARFLAIRGNCQLIRSDMGTNFTSAKKQIEDSIDMTKISEELKLKNIEWKMNAPNSSHKGGSWERKIASVRRILESCLLQMGNRGVTRDEFSTLLAEASQIVNNTPLWTIPNHPNDPQPLSPAMLLTLKGEPNPAPNDQYSEQDLIAYGKRRYRRVQHLAEVFWRQWRENYLMSLNRRHKWRTNKRCATIDDIVIVKDKQSPRNNWKLGRIVSIKHSDDGLVRTVDVKMPPIPNRNTPRIFTRSINDLVLLVPSNEHDCDEPAVKTAAVGSV